MKKTLNLGCGNRTYTEYPEGYLCLNMDNREDLPNVDIWGDVRDLSRFREQEFDYVLASDILEHFPFDQTHDILLTWNSVLTKGGTLELRVPNFEYAIRHYQDNHNMKHVSWMLMGGQDYPGNFHYISFNEAWLRELCEDANFEFVSCVEEGPNITMKVRKV